VYSYVLERVLQPVVAAGLTATENMFCSVLTLPLWGIGSPHVATSH
jgi:hypothetical protein